MNDLKWSKIAKPKIYEYLYTVMLKIYAQLIDSYMHSSIFQYKKAINKKRERERSKI